MKKPKPMQRLRRSAKQRSIQRRRPLLLESLEARNLLAGDLGLAGLAEGEAGDPLVAVRLEAVHPFTFQPLDAVHLGEEFVLLASVEDLRPNASGVYAAYFDLLYPSSFLSVAGDAGSAALVYGSGFGNGKSGDVSPGMVDEFGTFSGSSNPPGAGIQQLGGIRLVATGTGEVSITTNEAEETPAHDLLLFDRDDPVSSNLVSYGSLSLRILSAVLPETVDAIPDARVVDENSSENLFAVLENDLNSTRGTLVITEIDASSSHGDVTIANNGSLLVYTPNRGFVGTDQFTYTATAAGESDTATVTVQVRRVVSQEDRVAYDLAITDATGRPVSAVTVGDEFILHATAEDLRDIPSGVFAAYMDVQYTAGSAEVAGPVTYASAYANGRTADLSTSGEVDEVGAFAGATPLGPGEFEVFQIPFLATSPGRVVFEANAAEDVPDSETLLYDVDEAVGVDDILFGRVGLTVLAAVIAVDDTYELEQNSAAQTFTVLDNDINLGGGVIAVTSVSDANLAGSVVKTSDGRGVIYTPPSGFGGSEQFTYTIAGPAGTSTAEVTVHVQPTAALNDLVGIRLSTTDLTGEVIDSIGAGDEFLVQAFVRDLRGPGADRGVYAAYFDLLYDRHGVAPVPTASGPVGPAIDFGSSYQNGTRGDAAVPGIFNEIGAFQTDTSAIGTGESLLFAARFRAAPSRGEADSYQILEDAEAALGVLENDLPNSGLTTFLSDPADNSPSSDILIYEPVEAIPYEKVRYGDATIEITNGSEAAIATVSQGSAGGTVSIGSNGNSLFYSPAANFHGLETFTYSLDGATQIAVSVTVLPVNDAPTAAGDSYRARENHTLTVAANVGVLSNDDDQDGDTLSTVLVAGASHGDVELAADGSFSYVPDDNYQGADSFTYKVTDGQIETTATTVEIEVVPRPVSIRLQAVSANGEPVTQVTTDQSVLVRALVQDLRSPGGGELGIGAAYLDISYDTEVISPVTAATGALGLAIQFAPAYRNGIAGELLADGRLDNIGAFQSDFQALGGDELEVFRLDFNLSGPRAVDDVFTIAAGTAVSRLQVLRNEAELQWEITLDAQHANDSPGSDVAYLDPAEPVPEDDIRYGDLTLGVGNGALTIDSVGSAASGAVVTVGEDGVVNYEPVAGFTGPDSFAYTVVDAQGSTAIATVMLNVSQSWHNAIQPTDVNGDGIDSPLDALLIVNELNSAGAHELSGGVVTAFFDVDNDGHISPIDALLVINRLLQKAVSGEGEFVPAASNAQKIAAEPISISPLSYTGARSGRALTRVRSNAVVPALVTNTASLSDPALSERSRNSLDLAFGEGVAVDEFSDLLDSIADEIAPFWAAD